MCDEFDCDVGSEIDTSMDVSPIDDSSAELTFETPDVTEDLSGLDDVSNVDIPEQTVEIDDISGLDDAVSDDFSLETDSMEDISGLDAADNEKPDEAEPIEEFYESDGLGIQETIEESNPDLDPMEEMNQYMSEHNYGRDDYAEYSQDPEYQAINDRLLEKDGLDPVDYNADKDPMEEMNQYMSEHNYGRDDYAEYSQDPEYQAINDRLLEKDGFDPVEYDSSGETLDDFSESDEESVSEGTDEYISETQDDIPSEVTEEYPPETEDDTPSEVTEEYPPETEDDTPSEVTEEYPPETESDTPSEVTEEYPPETEGDTPSEVTEEYPSETESDTPSEVTEEYPPDTESDTPSKVTEEYPPETESDTPSEVTEEYPPDTESDTPSKVTEEYPPETESDTPSEVTEEYPPDTESDTPSEVTEEYPPETESDTPSEVTEEYPPETESDTSSEVVEEYPPETESDTSSEVVEEYPPETESDTPSEVTEEYTSETESDASIDSDNADNVVLPGDLNHFPDDSEFESMVRLEDPEFYESGSFYEQGINEYGFEGTCGPTSQANAINSLLGTNELTENKVLTIAVENDLCETGSLDPADNGGTDTDGFMNLYDKVNEQIGDKLDVERFDFDNALSVNEMADKLDQGAVLNIAVDSRTLWDENTHIPGELCDDVCTDHWITVTGVDRGPDGAVEGFHIIDSGGGESYADVDKYERMCFGEEGREMIDPTCIVITKNDTADMNAHS